MSFIKNNNRARGIYWSKKIAAWKNFSNTYPLPHYNILQQLKSFLLLAKNPEPASQWIASAVTSPLQDSRAWLNRLRQKTGSSSWTSFANKFASADKSEIGILTRRVGEEAGESFCGSSTWLVSQEATQAQLYSWVIRSNGLKYLFFQRQCKCNQYRHNSYPWF